MIDFDAVSTREFETALEQLRGEEPLVQALTNQVTMNDVANLILHWGGLPVMADSFGDAGEMAEIAGAILINTGQIADDNVEAMHEAGRMANDRGIPVVLDPVGVGSTPSRKAVAESLLSEVDFAVIKGNYGEISALSGVEADVKGVESIGDYDEIDETARSLADSTGSIVVASGVEDIVADADGAVSVSAGHEMMGEVVGTGCMLGATLAAFCGALEDARTGAVYGTLAFGLAGERATDLPYNGPASYRTNFLDSVAGFSLEVAGEVDLEGRVTRLE
ncbi:hydroxyethylthiazole kinase [Halostagnicola larsenii XH-48]|uniref:Hydroxyethylthiazole kinase n=1 Tax=Halostagnicola larsenii XH-48 TaxID=797299 RepID=W0JI43_9EURY|nr:hydroxyethylthiazole kinase [Halostagnicola larsenii]AHF98385.1 hydroxyethylthiazole kinase [Halostagnicola larsenii XH-48]